MSSQRIARNVRVGADIDSNRPMARFRLRVGKNDLIAVGPGKIALLEAIQETRSITAAARSIGMSYRRAWTLVDEMQASLRRPVVDSIVGGELGGGSALTDTGLELIALYRRIEATAQAACAADIKKMLKLVR